MPRRRPDADRILDTALDLAEEVGWERLRMREVAERLEMPLPDLAQVYRDSDALADAWFRRGRSAMLNARTGDFEQLSPAERAELTMQRWFDALAGHRGITAEMLRAKLYLAHPHHWVPLPFHLSRLIQWWREAAVLDAAGRRRQREEIALTLLFVRTLWVWAGSRADAEDSAARTLHRGLAALERRFDWWRAGSA